MATLYLDFLYNYTTGERRSATPASYQYDEGHQLSVNVPNEVTSAELHYWMRGMEESEAYVPTSITEESDGSYTILGNVPNSYFESSGDLIVYVVVTDSSAAITSYEGRISITSRSKPDDYVDDDPDNSAVSYVEQAYLYAQTSEAWAIGTIDGTAVESDADQYQNNSKYYSTLAASNASAAETSETNAATSASEAASSASAAAAIVAVASNGTVIVDGDDSDTTYVVTQRVEDGRLVTTLTESE